MGVMNMNNEMKKEIASWIAVFLLALAASWLIKNFLILNARVPSASMEPNVMTGDRLFGDRVTYKKTDPKRGDVVIFKYPDNEKELFIKRVIGMPGDTVMIIDGQVYINDIEEPLDEPYLAQEMLGTFGPYEVPEGHYFMMGDNRNYSADSRFWVNTYVARDKILAKAWFQYYPKIGKVQYPDFDYHID